MVIADSHWQDCTEAEEARVARQMPEGRVVGFPLAGPVEGSRGFAGQVGNLGIVGIGIVGLLADSPGFAGNELGPGFVVEAAVDEWSHNWAQCTGA